MFEVVRVIVDDGCFGYTAPPVYETVAKDVDIATAKSICRNLWKRLSRYGKEVNELVIYEWKDGECLSTSMDWGYTQEEKRAAWFKQMGWDYMAWQMGYPFK